MGYLTNDLCVSEKGDWPARYAIFWLFFLGVLQRGAKSLSHALSRFISTAKLAFSTQDNCRSVEYLCKEIWACLKTGHMPPVTAILVAKLMIHHQMSVPSLSEKTRCGCEISTAAGAPKVCQGEARGELLTCTRPRIGRVAWLGDAVGVINGRNHGSNSHKLGYKPTTMDIYICIYVI